MRRAAETAFFVSAASFSLSPRAAQAENSGTSTSAAELKKAEGMSMTGITMP